MSEGVPEPSHDRGLPTRDAYRLDAARAAEDSSPPAIGTWELDPVARRLTMNLAAEAMHSFAPETFGGTLAALSSVLVPIDRGEIGRAHV